MTTSIFLNMILSVALIVLFLDYIFLKKQIKNIIYFLDNIDSHKNRSKLQINLKYKEIEELAEKINTIIKRQEQIIVNTREQENKLKLFIASISHDLRTPLTSIKGYIQLIEKENISDGKRKKYTETVKKKIEILNKLINDFFTMSLYDSDEYELNLEKINITKLLTEILMDNYDNFKSKNITPRIKVKKEDLYIIADKVACERIINNLISNAIKYTTNDISIELSKKDNYCYVNISNECNDISDEDVERMCDRFFRIDKSRSCEGSGIGLYIVKTLIDRFGWQSIIEKKGDTLDIKIEIPLFNFEIEQK